MRANESFLGYPKMHQRHGQAQCNHRDRRGYCYYLNKRGGYLGGTVL